MQKDFEGWSRKKVSINSVESRPFFHEGELWWCVFGVNIGFEQDGGGQDYLRPVVVLRKFNSSVFWGIPLTRTRKMSVFYYQFYNSGDTDVSSAILSQVRLIDAKRLSHKIRRVSSADYSGLIKKFKALPP